MRPRPIDSTPTPTSRLTGWGWHIVGTVIAMTAFGICGVRADAGAACGDRDPATMASGSISIGAGRPERRADAPGMPREALTETERVSEDVEPDGASTYSWPAGVASRRLMPWAGRDSGANITRNVPLSSVDLTLLCRLLV